MRLIATCVCAVKCEKGKLAKRLASLQRRVFASGRPEVPMTARWAKTFMSLSWYDPMIMRHGLFVMLIEYSFPQRRAAAKGRAKVAAAAAPVAAPAAADGDGSSTDEHDDDVADAGAAPGGVWGGSEGR